MKVRFFSRLLIAISGLLLVMVAVLGFVYMNNILPFDVHFRVPGTLWERIITLAVTIVIAALGIFCISVLFRKGKASGGFVIQNSDFGEVSISIHAMENMVHQCVDAHKELTAKSIKMRRSRDGVQVELRVLLQNGVNIPQTVSTLQKEIKEYIADRSGVPVSEVRVMVETDPRVKSRHNVLEVAPQPVPATPKESVKEEQKEKPKETPKEEPKREFIFDKLFKSDAEKAENAKDELTEEPLAEEQPKAVEEIPTEDEPVQMENAAADDDKQDEEKEDGVKGWLKKLGKDD